MRNLPAGRMARLWLRARLEVAGRAVKVLEQKIQALNREQRRARHHAEETERVWNDALRQADLWFLRATVIGGSLQIGLAQSQVEGPAEAHIRWRSLMGVTYPAEVSLETPGTGAVGSVARSAALTFAAQAYARAVKLALDRAAATRALALLESELRLTRRRLRGLDNRWIPLLRETLHDVELRLAEEEREEMVRSKWVAERAGRRT